MSNQGYYCVAFVDLLGTEDANKFIREEGVRELEAAARLLATEVAKVEAFRNDFLSLFKVIGDQEKDIPLSRLGVPREVRDALRGNPIKHYAFSDSWIMHTSLNEHQGRLIPIETCFIMLISLALAQLKALSRRTPFRGGIEIGLAAAFSDDSAEILGPVLSDVVALEKNKAIFPRVAIGCGFRDYLLLNAQLDDSSTQNSLKRAYARRCLGLICSDTNDVLSVDVTTGDCAQFLGREVHRKLLETSKEFAQDQIARFTECPHIADKYRMLLSYLSDDRLRVLRSFD